MLPRPQRESWGSSKNRSFIGGWELQPCQSSSSGNRGTISGSQTPHSGQAAEFSSGPMPLQLPCGPLDNWGKKWGENVFW